MDLNYSFLVLRYPLLLHPFLHLHILHLPHQVLLRYLMVSFRSSKIQMQHLGYFKLRLEPANIILLAFLILTLIQSTQIKLQETSFNLNFKHFLIIMLKFVMIMMAKQKELQQVLTQLFLLFLLPLLVLLLV